MARAVLSVSVDFELALRLKELAKNLQVTESFIVSEALRAYFSQSERDFTDKVGKEFDNARAGASLGGQND